MEIPREQRDLYIGLTDRDWYEFLARRPGLDEVNFWRPGGGTLNPRPGAPFLLKLKAPLNAIVGVGFFERSVRYSIRDAWEFFGEKNGVEHISRLVARISKYVGRPVDDRHEIGCIFLDQPTFFVRLKISSATTKRFLSANPQGRGASIRRLQRLLGVTKPRYSA